MRALVSDRLDRSVCEESAVYATWRRKRAIAPLEVHLVYVRWSSNHAPAALEHAPADLAVLSLPSCAAPQMAILARCCGLARPSTPCSSPATAAQREGLRRSGRCGWPRERARSSSRSREYCAANGTQKCCAGGACREREPRNSEAAYYQRRTRSVQRAHASCLHIREHEVVRETAPPQMQIAVPCA